MTATDKAALPEAGGVVYTDAYTPDGYKLCITARGRTCEDAVSDLLAVMAKYDFHARPFVQTATTPKPAPKNTPPPPEEPLNDWEASADPLWNQTADQKAQATAGKDWGLVTFPPKAAELQPGDVYQVEANEYKAVAKEVSFWVAGGKYPLITHKMTSEYALNKFKEIFKGWEPVEDGEHHPINPPIILTIVGSSNVNKNGNPYHNLEAVRRVEK